MSPLWWGPSPGGVVSVGNVGAINYGFNYLGVNSGFHNFGAVVKLPAGTLVSITGYAAGHGVIASVNAFLFNYPITALLAQSAYQNLAAGSGVKGGQFWTGFPIGAVITAGTYVIGLEWAQSTTVEWSVSDHTGSFYVYNYNTGVWTLCSATSLYCGTVGLAASVQPPATGIYGQHRILGKAFHP